MISKIKIAILSLITGGFTLFTWLLIQLSEKSYELIKSNNFSINEMAWQIFGIIFCIGWAIYFGWKLVKQLLQNNYKILSIFVILISLYLAAMFIDLPAQVLSCAGIFSGQSECNITLSVGKDCMPSFGYSGNQSGSWLKNLSPFSLREKIFGTRCVAI